MWPKSRVLVFLLPFYLAGLVLGSHLTWSDGWLWWPAGLCTVFLAMAVFLGRRLGFLSTGLVLGLIGAAAAASVFTPPQGSSHVYHYREQTGQVFSGRLVRRPEISHRLTKLIIDTDEVIPHGGAPRPAAGLIRLTIVGDQTSLHVGDRVRFPAELQEITGFGNPGAFDFHRHNAAQGLWVRAFLKDPRMLSVIEESRDWAGPTVLVARLRDRASLFLDQTTSPPARGLIKALLIGIRDKIDPELDESFRRLGLTHLLSISGIHVGLVALVTYGLVLRLLMLRPKLALVFNIQHLAAGLSLWPMILYAWLAGAEPPTIRSALMISVYLLAGLVERPKDLLTTLAVAAWIILILEPGAVLAPSFQLSFIAVAAIILLSERLNDGRDRERIPEAGKGRLDLLRRRAWELLFVPAAATFGTGPIAVYHFFRFSLMTLPANIIFTPLISLIVIPPGLAALVLALISPWAAGMVFFVIERLLWAILAPMSMMAAWPGIELLLPRPGPAFLIAYFLIFVVMVFTKPWKKATVITSVVLGAYGLTLLWPYLPSNLPQKLKVTILDVGQGNSAHLALPDGTQIVIDGGGFRDSDFDSGENIVGPFLLVQGITKLDIVALTHPHPDHSGGLTFLVKNFQPKEFWSNGAPSSEPSHLKLLNAVRAKPMTQPALTNLFQPRVFGPISLEALAPSADFLVPLTWKQIQARQNDNSLVLKVRYGEISFLFPGDLGAAGETDLVRRQGSNIRADVLLAPHHGSSSSLTQPFLDAVQAKYVVFSAGRRNRFGLPAAQSVARVEAMGAKVFRTDRHGAVTCMTDGRTIEVKSFHHF